MTTRKKTVTPISEVEAFVLLDKTSDLQHYLLLSLFLHCGLSVHEVSSLRVHHINSSQKTMIITGKRQREIPLPEELMNSIQHHILLHHLKPKQYLLFTREQAKMSDRRIQQIVVEKTTAILGKPLYPHLLRESYIINELKKNTPVATIEQRLGISSIAPYVYVYLTLKNREQP